MAALLLAVACASLGGRFDDAENELPAIAPGHARIVYFNPRGMPLGDSADLLVDSYAKGASLGGARDGTFAYVDLEPGDHVVGVKDEWFSFFKRRVMLEEESTLYVLLGGSKLRVVPEAEARRILGPCRIVRAKDHLITTKGTPHDAPSFESDDRALGSTPLPEGLDRPAPGRARIVWYMSHRTPAWLDWGLGTYTLIVDGVDRAQVAPGLYGYLDLEPGRHTLHTWRHGWGPADNSGGHNPRSILVEADEVAFIEVSMTRANPLFQVTPEYAAIELVRLAYRPASESVGGVDPAGVR